MNHAQSVVSKPPYRVPSMQEIAAIPWNGLTVVSTFSGCGGSCLGYRMAGYRVLWANEFVPSAQESYRANAAASSILDGRDIRQVQVADILAATGLAVGDLDLLDGSPPCQAFSTAGKRAKGWGKAKRYEHGAQQQNETLFAEYIRLLAGLQPKVFVAENVSGLVKGVAKGYFLEILRGLRSCGYRVEARLLDAQWLGVPQTRQRIIFQGIRTDLPQSPAWPHPLPYRYSVRDALPEIGQVFHDTGGFVRNKNVTDGPCPSVTNGVNGLNSYHYQVVYDQGASWKQGNITDVPAPTERSGRAGVLYIEGANGFNHHAGSSLEMPMPTVQAQRPEQVVAPRAYRDRHGAFGHEGEITDQPAPTVLSDSIGTHWIEQLPHPTIQAGAGARTTSSWAHGTCAHPTEKRKFTIAELKRICAFPDDFVLKGSYAQQWERLGNSVPPVMMYHLVRKIAQHVFGKDAA